MIAPANRLIVVTALVLIPAALLAVAVPAGMAIAVLAALGLGVVAVFDLVRVYGELDAVRAALPGVTRMTQDREGEIAITFTKPEPVSFRLLVGLALPADISTEYTVIPTTLPSGASEARLRWPCTAHTRGRFEIENVYFASASPLGLWTLRKTSPARGEIRVYPNLLREQKHAAALFLNRGAIGVHAQRQVGKGREFEKLRDYIHGDSMDDIHWKATARRGEPVTKVYQVERTQEIYIVVDASRLSARPVAQPGEAYSAPQVERYVTAALLLGLAAERQGDLFGVLTFSNRVDGFVRARNGTAHFNACRDTLYTVQPRSVEPDFDEVMTFIRLRLRRRALLLFLTDLDDPVIAESFTRAVELIGRNHLVLVASIRPEGLTTLFEDGAVTSTDEIYRHLAHHIQWHNLREIQRKLHQRGVTLSFLESASLSPQLITQYMNVKQRQLI